MRRTHLFGFRRRDRDPTGGSRDSKSNRSATSRAAKNRNGLLYATGTGFIINDRGDVVTNNHVVDGCSRIKFGLNGQGLVQGRLVASDATNDLAVANFPFPRTRVASFSNTIKSRPGDDLVVFGYPLVGLLSTSGNLTRGSLTAMAGVQDDVRYMQISAPVQPGNSGGPVLGMGGEVIGVVTYKLNALETMKRAGGDIPQNVNFALKASILRLFLDSHSIPYTVPTTPLNLRSGRSWRSFRAVHRDSSVRKIRPQRQPSASVAPVLPCHELKSDLCQSPSSSQFRYRLARLRLSLMHSQRRQ